SKNDTSVMLDLLRATAAQMVCVGHALSFFASNLRPTSLPYMQNVGVLLFFLISGFLITYTLVERSKAPNYSFGHFFIERFARIYSGLIPALVLIAIIDGAVVALTGDPTVLRFYTFKTMVANIFMLEGYQGVFPDIFQWSAFGSASPLWTLGIEWQIYLFVGALFFMARNLRSAPFLIPIAVFFGQTPIHFLFGAFQVDGVGKGLFALWLGGSLIYLALRSSTPNFTLGMIVGIGGIAGFVMTAHPGAEYNFKLYPFLAAVFFGLVAATQSTHLLASSKIERPIRFFADYSFSLYLVHHTIMYAFWTISSVRGMGAFAGSVIVSNIVAIVLANIGEKNHRKMAKSLTARMLSHDRDPVVASR